MIVEAMMALLSSEHRNEIYSTLLRLGEVEQELVRDIVRRLKKGQKDYGFLNPGKKNWKRELYEELLDGIVYAAMEVMESGISKVRRSKVRK